MAGSDLAKIDLPSAPLAKVEELRDHLIRLSKVANLVTPIVRQDYIPPLHRVSLRAVLIDSQVNNKGQGTDTYRDSRFCNQEERALTKTGLLRILTAAGGSMIQSKRTDDGRVPHYVTWEVTIAIPQLDGRTVYIRGSKEVDYRDGSPQIANWKGNQLAAARQHTSAHAETKALNRAIRAGLQLRQKYTLEELEKPFVIPALVADLDMTDPEIKRMAVQAMLGAHSALYGGEPHEVHGSLPEGVSQADVVDAEPVDDEEPTEPPSPFDDVGDDPFDDGPPPPLPIPQETIEQVPTADEKRFRFLEGMNVLASKAIEALGEAKANAIFRARAGEIDWVNDEAKILVEVRNAIIADVKGGAS